MVKNYSVPRLTSKTPDGDQAKLMSAIRAVAGVESVSLNPGSHRFEVTSNGKQEPQKSEIEAASQKAGFQIEAAYGERNQGSKKQNGESNQGNKKKQNTWK